MHTGHHHAEHAVRSMFHNWTIIPSARARPARSAATVTDLNRRRVRNLERHEPGADPLQGAGLPFHIYLEQGARRSTAPCSSVRELLHCRRQDVPSRDIIMRHKGEGHINSHFSGWRRSTAMTPRSSKIRGQVPDDTSGATTYAHNLVPDLESTTDTFKVTPPTRAGSRCCTYSTGDVERTIQWSQIDSRTPLATSAGSDEGRHRGRQIPYYEVDANNRAL